MEEKEIQGEKVMNEIEQKIQFRLDRLKEQYDLIKDSKELVYIKTDTEARIDELESLLEVIKKTRD